MCEDDEDSFAKENFSDRKEFKGHAGNSRCVLKLRKFSVCLFIVAQGMELKVRS